MHLLGTLSTERPSAAGGHATIYRRGTATPATTYTTFAGGGSAAPATHTLDGYGSVVRYVNELVDVTVYNAAGASILGPVTDGVNATAVEIIHPHVTGTSYADSSTGVNKPSTLQLLVDKLYDTFGGNDFQITATGNAVAAALLKDSVGPVFNVMSSSFGATGNGVTNDTTAIQAAITAAGSAGGGTVFFPPGTYRLTTAIAIAGDKIRFQASGDGAVTIKQAGASEYCLSFSHITSGQSFSCHGIRFEGVAASDSKLLTTLTNSDCYYDFSNCRFTGKATSGSEMVLNARFRFNHCEFVADASTAALLFDHQPNSIPNSGITIVGGRILWATTSLFKNTGTIPISIIGTDIVRANVAAGPIDMLTANVGPVHFTAASVRTLGPAVRITSTGTVVREAASLFGASVAPLGTVPLYSSAIRDHASLRSSIAAASYTPDSTLYMVHEVVNSNAAHQWGNPTGPPPAAGVAHVLILRYKNTNGGAVTPTFDTAYKGSAVAVASGSGYGWIFVYDTTLAAWTQVAVSGVYAS